MKNCVPTRYIAFSGRRKKCFYQYFLEENYRGQWQTHLKNGHVYTFSLTCLLYKILYHRLYYIDTDLCMCIVHTGHLLLQDQKMKNEDYCE